MHMIEKMTKIHSYGLQYLCIHMHISSCTLFILDVINFSAYTRVEINIIKCSSLLDNLYLSSLSYISFIYKYISKPLLSVIYFMG